MRTNQSRSIILAVLLCLLSGATALRATPPPQLWPTFSTPSTIMNVNLVGAGQAGDDFMATTTFQGAYNQKQLSTRLYVSVGGDDPYWLSHAVPSSVTVSQFSFTTTDPDGALKALLSTYGSSIAGYYICDPFNAPETCNMAMTLAGIHDGMVVNPDNLTVMQASTVPLLGDLRVYSVPSGSQYTWVGNYSPLVNDTAVNQIANPSGTSNTTGWSTSGGTISTGTGTGTCSGQGQTLKYTSTAANTWAFYDPTITATATTRPYIFSVQVCVSAGSPVFLDAWNGAADIQSGTIAAGAGWQTLQLAVPIPLSGVTGNTTIKLQVRTSGSTGTTVFFHNAAAIGNRVAVDMYQYVNQLSQTTSTILAQDFANSYNLRDYQIAGKMFTFDLSSDNGDETTLYNEILTQTSSSGAARTHNTPVLGYVDDEGHDVAYLSNLNRGLFLNASDDYNNGSIWASLPQPSSLSQPAPTGPFKTFNGTVYMAITASDGDNVSIIQHQNFQRWTHGLFLGAVPIAWTMSPGMMYFAPGIISNYYTFLPQSQEIMAGPSGVGYGTAESTNTGTQSCGSGTDISCLASLTNQFMTAESMSTVTSWASSTTDLETYAQDVNVPHVVYLHTKAYERKGNSAQTVVDGQDTFYNSVPADQIAAIETAVNSNYSASAPTYIEVLQDNLTLSQDDTLYIAQQLQRDFTFPFVFTTPSELALTQTVGTGVGTVTSSPQAVLGATLNSTFPQNLIWNSNGQEPGRGVTSSSWAIGGSGHGEQLYTNQDYLGGGHMLLKVPKNTGVNCYSWEKLDAPTAPVEVDPEIKPGRYYLFSVSVAGTEGSTAFMTIYDGSANHQVTATIHSATWTTLSEIVQMQTSTGGQIQVGLTPSTTTAQVIYFGGTPSMQAGWYYSPQGGGTTSTANAGSTTYNSAQGASQAFYLNVPANDGSQWIAQFPTVLAANTPYTASVDVAGTGQAYLDVWNGSSDATSSTVNLSTNWQTVTVNATTGASTSGVQYEIRMPSSTSAQTVYFRNASLVKSGSGGIVDFQTGLESGDPQLSATNTVDSTSPGGGDSNVSSAILQSTTIASRGGTDAIQYGGTASGGATTHAYMEAFTSNSTTLSSTSRLSYWIYPITPLGQESGASSMTSLNSTCAAIDITFTNGTALRNLGVKDQFGNTLNPASECNHLQPDQWNYVTVSLSSLSGLTVAHIDVGYDQPGASGNYGGYVDDISLTH